jgi:hypothetical protein
MTPILTHAAAFVAGAIVLYLVLRNNPRYKAKVDAATDKIEKKLDER